MIFINYLEKFDFEYDIQGILRSFYPGMDLKTIMPDNEPVKGEVEGNDILNCLFDDEKLSLQYKTFDGFCCEKSISRAYDEDGTYDRKETKNSLKRALYDILKEKTKKDLPWGTLSGIRPTKITSSMLEQGMTKEEVFRRMKEEYYISDIKAEESINISEKELKILNKIDYRNGYSIYIGIPFCPSTCLYCSFTSNPIGLYAAKIEKYLDALFKEIDFCADIFKNKKLCTIYIGGGTPTTLSPSQLDRLLSKISNTFDTKSLFEFTIEAGRPDSITLDKLKVIQKYDITRISINPQTMKDETLKIIGRHHSVKQFLEAYDVARGLGFDNINMDFILGLPGENIDDVRNSMQWVEKLKPESLTIHSLAIKRAARLNLEQRAGIKYEITNTEEMMQVTKETAGKLSLKPYYLYRQKNMAGNLENVGYSLEGKEGIYNILIMEEKQTILALGAGSSSKMVLHKDDEIGRVENVKDVDLYIERIDEMIERKRKYILEKFEL